MAEDKNKKIEEVKTEEKEEVVSNEIKETTGNDVPIYEDYDEEEIAENTGKKKFKFKKRYIAAIVAGVAILGLIGNNIISAQNKVTYVTTTPVVLGDIENVLSISGTVQSAETKTYFADVAAPIETVNVKVGDKVSAGDVIYTYDQAELDLAKQTAELAITQAKSTYSAIYDGTAAADRKYAEGMTAQQINDRIDAITAEIDDLSKKIEEKKARMNQTLTDLQKTAMDINQNGISDSSEGYFDNGNNGYIYRNETDTKSNGEYTEPTESDRQMSLAVQQSIQDVTYALSNDPEITGWNNQITTLKEEQSHLSSAKAAQINGSSAQASKAQYESTELSQEDKLAKIDEVKEGIKADFNGVVTEVAVVDGATVAAGTKVVTMANIDDVEVTVDISKSDLPKVAVGQEVDITINGKDYEGEITKISGTASKNSNGVAVVSTVIKVTNPDSDIILGVEANNKIHAEHAENTVVLPYSYVLTDSVGDYVYVLENGVVTRKDVTIGISNSTQAQIVEGLSEGDEVITSDTTLLTEGMEVVANNM